MIDMTIDMQATAAPRRRHFDGNGSCDATREANRRADRMPQRYGGNGVSAGAQTMEMTPYGGTAAPAGNTEYGTDHEWPQAAETGMNSIPQDSFNEPLNADEAARNSWRALLARNVGRNVLVRFLMGTQNLITVEGELYEVGTDYIVIYQPLWDSHITADIYAVKFVEFREPPGVPLG